MVKAAVPVLVRAGLALKPIAVAAGPAAVLALPSAGAMTLVAVLPPVQNTPDGSPNAILDALSPSYQPAPPAGAPPPKDALWDFILGKKTPDPTPTPTTQPTPDEPKTDPAPQTSTAGGQQGAGGSGKSGKGTKDRGKDFSQQGTVDQLKSIQKDQKMKNIESTKKSEQNVDNANKKIKSSADVGHED
jgi:hypothetical protein